MSVFSLPFDGTGRHLNEQFMQRLNDPQRLEYLQDLRRARQEERAFRRSVAQRSAAISAGLAVSALVALFVAELAATGQIATSALELNITMWLSLIGMIAVAAAITYGASWSSNSSELLRRRAHTAWASSRLVRYEHERGLTSMDTSTEHDDVVDFGRRVVSG